MNTLSNWSLKEELFPGLWVYRDVIKKELDVINRLNQISESAKKENNSRYSWTFGYVGYLQKKPEYRDCEDIKIGNNKNPQTRTDFLAYDLWRDIKKEKKLAADDYCQKYNVEMNYWEAINCIKYVPGQHFQEHADHGFSYSATVSLVGYINDDYEGGELMFPKLNILIKPQAGDLYIFPSTYLFSHRAMPVISGTKYSLVTMLDYNDHAHNEEFMSMRQKWIDKEIKK